MRKKFSRRELIHRGIYQIRSMQESYCRDNDDTYYNLSRDIVSSLFMLDVLRIDEYDYLRRCVRVLFSK